MGGQQAFLKTLMGLFAWHLQAGWGGVGMPLEGEMPVKRIGKMSKVKALAVPECC